MLVPPHLRYLMRPWAQTQWNKASKHRYYASLQVVNINALKKDTIRSSSGYALHKAIAESWAEDGNDPLKALRWMKEVERLQGRDDPFMTSALARSFSKKILGGEMKHQDYSSSHIFQEFVSRVGSIIEKLLAKGIKPSQNNLTELCNFYISTLASDDQAVDFLSRMMSICTPDINTYNAVLGICVRSRKDNNNINRVRAIVNDLLNHDNVKPNAQTFILCFQACAPTDAIPFNKELATYFLDILKSLASTKEIRLSPVIFNAALSFNPPQEHLTLSFCDYGKMLQHVETLQNLNKEMLTRRNENAQLMEDFVEIFSLSGDIDCLPDAQTHVNLLNTWASTRTAEGMLKAEYHALRAFKLMKKSKKSADFGILVPIFRGWIECFDNDICKSSRLQEWIEKIEEFDEFSSSNAAAIAHLYGHAVFERRLSSIQSNHQIGSFQEYQNQVQQCNDLVKRLMNSLTSLKGGEMLSNFEISPIFHLMELYHSMLKSLGDKISNRSKSKKILKVLNNLSDFFKTLHKYTKTYIKNSDIPFVTAGDVLLREKLSFIFVKSLQLHQLSFKILPTAHQERMTIDLFLPHIRMVLHLCELLHGRSIKNVDGLNGYDSILPTFVQLPQVKDATKKHSYETIFVHILRSCSLISATSDSWKKPMIKSDLLRVTMLIFDQIQPGGNMEESGVNLSPVYRDMVEALNIYYDSMPNMEQDVGSMTKKILTGILKDTTLTDKEMYVNTLNEMMNRI